MSTVRPELVVMRHSLRDRVGRARGIVDRATAWPFGVRLTVFVLALVAEGLAYPTLTLTPAIVLMLLVFAAVPAVWPRGAAVTVFWLVTCLAWLVATTLYDASFLVPRLIALSAVLYLVHSGAALAAVLPYDAVVDPTVIGWWALRAVGTVIVAGGVSVVALKTVWRLGDETYVAATVGGLALALAVVWLLSAIVRRQMN